MHEFDLIKRYFQKPAAGSVKIGVGDDAAVLAVPPGYELVVTTDTLVSGVHFFADVSPATLGHKALAVNLSDLAAMGAQPAWFTLALTLSQADPEWVDAFAQGLFLLAESSGIALVGGDTTQGPLSITITAMGLVPQGQALTRGGAQTGDLVFVSGTIGDAAQALADLKKWGQTPTRLRARLECPTPRLALGQALRGLATACIDVSDGLVQDLGHILAASGRGAKINLSPFLSGDDYELLFTAREHSLADIMAAAVACECVVTPIGHIQAEPGLHLIDAQGQEYQPEEPGFQHFSEP